MAKWYLRDRGQVCGPFSRDEILEMQDQGTVASFHEVSADKRQWRVIDDIPELSQNTPRKPQQEGTDEDQSPAPRQGDGRSRKYQWVVGGVLTLILIGGTSVAGLLVYRSKHNAAAGTPSAGAGISSGDSEVIVTSVPHGPITFATQTPTRERDQVLGDSVGLVVVGLTLKGQDGVETDVPEFGTGSGFAVSPSGHLLTNRHVVEELVAFRNSENQRKIERELKVTLEPKVWVFFGMDNKFVAEVVHVSPDYDLAILKVDRPASRYFALSQTREVEIPLIDFVSSLGFPGSDRAALKILSPDKKITPPRGASIQRHYHDADFKYTKENGGIKKNSFLARPDPKFRETSYLVHTARIAGGNSGGPLITRDGTVIGINTLGITTKVGNLTIDKEGQFFAQTLPQLRKEIDKKVPDAVWRELRD